MSHLAQLVDVVAKPKVAEVVALDVSMGRQCTYFKRDVYTEAECFRKPGNPGYREPNNGNKASTVEIILADGQNSLIGTGIG